MKSTLITAAWFLITISVLQAEYLLTLTRQGEGGGDVFTGTRFRVQTHLENGGGDVHNAGIYRLEFSRPGLMLESYRWMEPYDNKTISDDSKPGWDVLPVFLNEENLQGPGYPIGVVDMELSNAIVGSRRFATGTLVELSFRIPDNFPTGPLVITPVVEGFSNGFTVVPTQAGTALELTVLEKPADYNTAPMISGLMDRTMQEDTSLSGILFEVDDDEEFPEDLSVTITSSHTSLVNQNGLTLTGTGKTRSLSVTPVPDGFGETTITLTVSDGRATTQGTFNLSVNNINDPPDIGVITDFEIDEGTGVLSVPFIVEDSDNDLNQMIITVNSSNPELFNTSNMVIDGAGNIRSLSLAPAPQAFGVATITIRVFDGAASVTEGFQVRVINRNDPPSLGVIEGQTLLEDAILTVALSVSDSDHDIGGLNGVVSAANTKLFPGGSLIYRSSPSPAVVLTPAANETGVTEIRVEISDGEFTVSRTFEVSVQGVNDAPEISSITNQEMKADEFLSLLVLVSDVDDQAETLEMSASSSNQEVVRDSDLGFSGEGGDRQLNITPVLTGSGVTQIEIEVRDPAGASATVVFELNVEGVEVEVGKTLEYLDWQRENNIPEREAGPEQDADGDGILNVVEYIFGSDPGSEINEGLPRVIEVQEGENVVPGVSFIRNLQANGAVVEVVATTSLGVMNLVELQEEIEDLGNGLQRVVFKLPPSTVGVKVMFFITRVRIK